jgi:hypothetical protein
LDAITEYAFDNCRNLLDAPGFAATVLDATKKGQPRIWELQLFPWIVKLRQAPKWVLKIISSATAVFVARRAVMDAQVRDLQRRVNAGENQQITGGPSSISCLVLTPQMDMLCRRSRQ